MEDEYVFSRDELKIRLKKLIRDRKIGYAAKYRIKELVEMLSSHNGTDYDYKRETISYYLRLLTDDVKSIRFRHIVSDMEKIGIIN